MTMLQELVLQRVHPTEYFEKKSGRSWQSFESSRRQSSQITDVGRCRKEGTFFSGACEWWCLSSLLLPINGFLLSPTRALNY